MIDKKKSELTYNYYVSGGLLFKTKLPEEICKKLEEISDSKIKHNEKLAGNIQEEYLLDSDSYKQIVNSYLEVYKKAFASWYGETITDIKIVATWINIMKAGDFNPPHIHTNCKLSSVIFMNDLNEEIKKEREDYKGTHGGKPASLNFNYGVSQPHLFIQGSHHIPQRGDFFIFPAQLLHWVFPYKSNFTRISIASNYDF